MFEPRGTFPDYPESVVTPQLSSGAQPPTTPKVFRASASLIALLIVCAACGPTVSGQVDAEVGTADAPLAADARVTDGRPPPPNSAIYAHSATELFRIDPETLGQVSVGTFSFAGDQENITDLAIDKTGAMLGISLNSVYSIDRETAVATLLSSFPPGEGGLTSLSFVPTNLSDPSSAERLVAADFDGDVWEINPNTGQRTHLGNYGANIGSSGDIVSIIGFGTLATVNVQGEATDHLARLDPVTWQATIVGDTGYDKIFGIGFWGGDVYGFTDNMDFVTIDAFSGQVTSTRVSSVKWWGAAVTTLAPIVD